MLVLKSTKTPNKCLTTGVVAAWAILDVPAFLWKVANDLERDKGSKVISRQSSGIRLPKWAGSWHSAVKESARGWCGLSLVFGTGDVRHFELLDPE